MSDVPAHSGRRIAVATFWQVGSQAVTAIIGMLTVKLVAVGLTKELAGIYNSSYGYLQLFGILADFGLYAVAVREISRTQGAERRSALGAFLAVRSGTLAVALTAALLLAWLLPAWRQTPLPLSILIAAMVPLFTLLAGVFRVVFQVHYQMHFVFLAEVAQRIVAAALIGTLVLQGVVGSNDLHDLHLFLFAGAVGAFILFLASGIFAQRLEPGRPRVERDQVRMLFHSALPYGIAYLCIAAYRQLDLTLIALLRDDFALQNASYGFAQRMAEIAYLLPTFLLNAVLPMLSADHDALRTQRLRGMTLLALLALGIAVSLGAALWARPLALLLTTAQYLSTAARPGADTALLLLAGPMLLNGLVLYAFYTLLAQHAWRPLVRSLLIGAGTALFLNLLLIPRLGFVGAGLTQNIVHVLLVCLLLPQSLRQQPVTLPAGTLLRLLLFAAIVGAGLFALRPLLTSSLAVLLGLAASALLILGSAWGTGIAGRLRASLAPKQRL